MDPKAHRLATGAVPRRYDLHLHASPEADTFQGDLRLTLEVREAVHEVELHAVQMEIQEAILDPDGDAVALDVEPHPRRETVVLRSPRALQPGAAVVQLRYEGTVRQDMAGLYQSRDGRRVALATQCEATDARSILPCFDEPAFKAVHAWTVTTNPGLTVLSNGAVAERVENEDGTVTWRFEETAPLSSYLVALAIGRFASTEAAESRGVPFRVWAPEGLEALGDHARDLAVGMLPWYEDVFGQPYAFGKYDQLGVPSFSSGAMENAGLVVFRKELLLVDPEAVAAARRYRVAHVVAHEFAHMWFGDLVTLAWWDDLWLNESFAEWIANELLDELHPDLETWLRIHPRKGGALATDALSTTHPVYQPVATPEAARELFDVITYGKGSAVLRMLNLHLGPETMRAGLRSYMAAFAGGNARGADLWQHLSDAAGADVASLVGAWITRPGHPVVHLSLDADDPATLVARQERFLLEGPEAEEPWPIPLAIRYADDAGVHALQHLLDEPEARIPLKANGPVRWVVGNAGDVGFYRVAPDEALLDGLASAWPELDPAERLSILTDGWDLVRAGLHSPTAHLALLARVLPKEDHPAVLRMAAARLAGVGTMLEHAGDDAALAGYRGWVRALVGPKLAALPPEGSAGDDDALRENRATLLGALALAAQDPDALARCRDLAARERQDPEAVDAELAGVAVHANLAFADAAGYEEHVATYEARRDGGGAPVAVERYLLALGEPRDPALLQQTLDGLLTPLVPKQAVGPLLAILLSHGHSQHATWDLLRKRWHDIEAATSLSMRYRILGNLGNLPPDLSDQVGAFLDELDPAVGDGEVARRARERLALRSAFYGRALDDVVAWAVSAGA